jgi:hypothetical protein
VKLAEDVVRRKAARKAAPRSRSALARARKDKTRVLVMVGTRKGAFIFQSDRARRQWKVIGPHFPGWGVHHLALDQRAEPTFFAALYSDVYGTNIHRSKDFGQTWQMADGPKFPPDASPPAASLTSGESAGAGLKVKRVWRVEPGHAARPNEVWAGADPGALFKSEDGGQTWAVVEGLTYHPTREGSWFPGAGGLMVHCILPHPTNPNRMHVAISAAGVFRTDDGGQTWSPKNRGTQACFLPEGQQWPDVGQCCHHLIMSRTNPNLLFQQNHCGVYRSEDAGDSWSSIAEGLPVHFGFPIGILGEQTIFVVPEVSDEYRYTPNGVFRVYRSRNGGRTWQALSRGLPQKGAYLNVLREGIATDTCSPGGVYVGTSTGQLFYSRNEGDSWRVLADTLPPVYSVSTAVVEST